MTKLAMLLAAGLIVPALWGSLTHWLMNRLWPQRWRRPDAPNGSQAARPATDFWDYQI